MKTKAKKKTAGKKATKKTSKKSSGKKQLDAAQVRAEIAGMVKDSAKELAVAVIDRAEIDGELARTKYLFEMAGIFPSPESEGGTTQDAVAKSLMRALGIPEEPITYDEEGNVVSPVKDVEGRGALAEKKFGSEEDGEEGGARAGTLAPPESAARESAGHESAPDDVWKESDLVE